MRRATPLYNSRPHRHPNIHIIAAMHPSLAHATTVTHRVVEAGLLVCKGAEVILLVGARGCNRLGSDNRQDRQPRLINSPRQTADVSREVHPKDPSPDRASVIGMERLPRPERLPRMVGRENAWRVFGNGTVLVAATDVTAMLRVEESLHIVDLHVDQAQLIDDEPLLWREDNLFEAVELVDEVEAGRGDAVHQSARKLRLA